MSLALLAPETVVALLKLGKFAWENLEAGMNGEKTDEEIMAALENMQTNVREASAGWRAARET